MAYAKRRRPHGESRRVALTDPPAELMKPPTRSTTGESSSSGTSGATIIINSYERGTRVVSRNVSSSPWDCPTSEQLRSCATEGREEQKGNIKTSARIDRQPEL